jgi:hypothetical protein
VGLFVLVASLSVMPWVSVSGEEATLRDIGDAYSALDGLGGGEVFAPPDVGVPDVSVPDVTLPDLPAGTLPDGSSPDDGLGPVVTPPDLPTSDTYTPPDGGDLEPFHELYAKGLCWALLVVASLAVLTATLWVPRTKGGRMGTGFLTAGLVGLGINALDERGRTAPRVTGALVATACLGAHVTAVLQMFDADGAPDPAIGAWAGAVGLAIVVVGCIVGTRTRTRSAAASGWG